MKRVHSREKEQFKKLFQQENIENFEDRFKILEIFLQTERHVTVSELVQLLNDNGYSFAPDFVRNTLKLMCRFGFARKNRFDNGEMRYEHRHLGQQRRIGQRGRGDQPEYRAHFRLPPKARWLSWPGGTPTTVVGGVASRKGNCVMLLPCGVVCEGAVRGMVLSRCDGLALAILSFMPRLVAFAFFFCIGSNGSVGSVGLNGAL